MNESVGDGVSAKTRSGDVAADGTGPSEIKPQKCLPGVWDHTRTWEGTDP